MLQLRPLPLLRGARVGPKWWFPNLCCEKRPMGGGGSKARGGKWKNMLIVSSHPIMALATRGSWPGSSGKSIYSRKAVLYYLYVWLCIEDAWYKHCCLNIWPRSLCCWWKYGFRSPWSGILASHLLEINICTLLENLNKFFLITQVADQESTWAGLKGRFQTVGERGGGGGRRGRGWGGGSKVAGGVTETFQWLAARAHLQCSEHQCPIYWEVKVYAPFLYPLPMALLSRSLKYEREHEHFAAPMRQKYLVATNIEARDREHWGHCSHGGLRIISPSAGH